MKSKFFRFGRYYGFTITDIVLLPVYIVAAPFVLFKMWRAK